MFHRRQKKSPPEAIADPTALPARHPLDAVPLPAAGVTVDEPAPGAFILWRAIGLPAHGVFGRIGRRLGWQRVIRVEMDATGREYWRLVDGERSLAAIAELMQSRFGWSVEQSRRAVATFTRDLMLRGLIRLRLAEDAP